MTRERLIEVAAAVHDFNETMKQHNIEAHLYVAPVTSLSLLFEYGRDGWGHREHYRDGHILDEDLNLVRGMERLKEVKEKYA